MASTTRWADLKTRVLGGLGYGALVLFVTWWDEDSFVVMLMFAAYILFKEWMWLTRARHGFFVPFGMLYISAALFSLEFVRHFAGWQGTYLLFALVWTGDIAAYFAGKSFGKHKIAPSISPGKSWEGLAASIVATALLSIIVFTDYLNELPQTQSIALGVAFATIGLLGDLFESWLKRKAGVKDSGKLIPGHGGLFDRVDALMPCAILAARLMAVHL